MVEETVEGSLRPPVMDSAAAGDVQGPNLCHLWGGSAGKKNGENCSLGFTVNIYSASPKSNAL